MALMIPDSIRPDASQGEKTLYATLRDRLPDDFLVWYEPEIKGFYPDFVVLSPSFGLLVLEVKGWYCGNIIKASEDLFETKRKGKDGVERTAMEKSPLKQGHGYFTTITICWYGILPCVSRTAAIKATSLFHWRRSNHV